MNEQYMRKLISLLQTKFPCTIIEFPQIQGISYKWGLVNGNADSGFVTVFSFWNNRDIYDANARFNLSNYLREHFNGAKLRVIHIVLSENNTDYNHMISSYNASNAEMLQQGNLIIEDMMSGQTVYYSQGLENLNSLIRDCMINLVQMKRNKRSFIPKITYTIIGINVLVYIICVLISGNPFEFDNSLLVSAGANARQLVENGEYYRLITCMFLHGGLIHIACNMYSLYCIGPLVEQVYGKLKYILIYFIAGISGSVLSALFMSYKIISVGASGAIFGLLGAVLVVSIKLRKQIGKNLLLNILSVIVINLIISFTLPNIDYSAHIGGLIGGIITGMLFWSPKTK